MGGPVDVAVVGAGAAGLMAAIQAARAGARVACLDGAERLGAKIRISGGGRCNVTNDVVTAADFRGASPRAIGKVLRQWDVAATRAFFAELGVELVREATGKLFPATNRASTVVDALLAGALGAGVVLRHPFRVEHVDRRDGSFLLEGGHGALEAARVVLATGGRSVPETGSDGGGYELARGLGHTLHEPVLPALVPLLLPDGDPLTALKGVSAPVALEVAASSGKRLCRVEGALLLTHFGLSGPAVLDVSRHLLAARAVDPQARLSVAWLPGRDARALDAEFAALGAAPVLGWLRERLPARLAAALLERAGLEPDTRGDGLRREARRRLVGTLLAMPLPVTGSRGFAYAEVTAGGVPLTEVRLETLASRVCDGLHLCGEILDVDGRIGGFNFQWAWASGTVAGRGAARAGAA